MAAVLARELQALSLADGYLTAEQLIADKPISGKQNVIERHMPAEPKEYCPRGSTASAART